MTDSDTARSTPSASERYRQRWRWDRVSKGTHLLNCWYQRNCAFNVYSRDGTVLFEEPVGAYPRTNDSVPDFNPRGCQKGACYSVQMRDPARVTRPLKRAGERGEGRWEEVPWDQALSEIADGILRALADHGSESVVFDQGGSMSSAVFSLSVFRFARLLDAIILDTNCELGDEQQGAAVTLGIPVACRSADDYFNSDLIFIWGGNPAYTQIPNCHFLNEARCNGARIVAISPDYNASAIHADTWVPVRPGTDAALALSMSQVVLAEGLHNADFVREQTDLPFLVRRDTGEFLRESDFKARARSDRFYVFDLTTKSIAVAPSKTLRLGSTVPALEGEFEVETRSGKVTVAPVLQLLRERLDAEYTPEKASEICGVHPDMIRDLGRAMARARAASGVPGASISKYYHGDLMMRAQLLVFALCGQMGRKGAGLDTLPYLILDGGLSLPYVDAFGKLNLLKTMAPLIPAFLALKAKGYTNEFIAYDLARRASPERVNSVLFWYQYAGLKETSGRSKEWDPHLPRELEDYMRESAATGGQTFLPPEMAPKVLFTAPGNTLRRVRGGDRIAETLFRSLDLIVGIDTRLSSTALYCDYVLPAAGSYEKADVNEWYTPLAPFAHATVPATAPLGDSKPEWEIMTLLAKKLQDSARSTGLRSFTGLGGRRRRIDDIYDRMTFGGKMTERDQEGMVKTIVEMSACLGKQSWEGLKDSGFARFTGFGGHPANFANATDIQPGETIAPHTWRTEKKLPWPTLTRRMQFYIDHPLYMELGEQLPVHKDPPTAGGPYPLTMTGGHTRHSIHASFRANPVMLNLQRGEPAAFVSGKDAAARGIQDGDMVRVYNDVGEFLVRAKVSAGVQPGQVVVYHAWENYQFEGGMGHRNVIPSPINPVELAGGYFHLRPGPAILQPGQSDRDTRIELARADGR